MIQNFCFFNKILQLGKSEDADFEYNDIIFKFYSKYTQIKVFLHQTLQQHNFENADFKYDNIFNIFTKFCNYTDLRVADFKNDNMVFKFQPKTAK